MIDPKDANLTNCRKCFGELLDARAPSKKHGTFYQACVVEATYTFMAQVLNGIRQFILDSGDQARQLGGEESPFVKRIDELVPRPEKK